jgi:hypothetical protein
VGGTYNLARRILTMVSKSWVCMTNNYSRVEKWWIHGVVVDMAIGIADSVGRVGVDEIGKKG